MNNNRGAVQDSAKLPPTCLTIRTTFDARSSAVLRCAAHPDAGRQPDGRLVRAPIQHQPDTLPDFLPHGVALSGDHLEPAESKAANGTVHEWKGMTDFPDYSRAPRLRPAVSARADGKNRVWTCDRERAQGRVPNADKVTRLGPATPGG